MSQANYRKGSWFIGLSLALAMVMTLFPLPDAWQLWRPAWVMLVLSYWSIRAPERVGLFWAFVCGLLLDVLLGTSLGVHSFALALTTFIIKLLQQRIRLFPLWKQALMVAFLSLIYIMISFWLIRLTGKSEETMAWPSVIINGLLWPWLYLLLRNFSGFLRVN
ncbi:rod shape-determining protein MreD [Kangiella sp. TOML190]|uniref:rod shape-determining protein MreD n=1 Tax=Kangiella sp. TOML190 TaxID=2931351 RepID=UPI00203CA0D5|nr:rod shape-determining protein MreD [Kangiella sp. TOML190]